MLQFAMEDLEGVVKATAGLSFPLLVKDAERQEDEMAASVSIGGNTDKD